MWPGGLGARGPYLESLADKQRQESTPSVENSLVKSSEIIQISSVHRWCTLSSVLLVGTPPGLETTEIIRAVSYSSELDAVWPARLTHCTGEPGPLPAPPSSQEYLGRSNHSRRGGRLFMRLACTCDSFLRLSVPCQKPESLYDVFEVR